MKRSYPKLYHSKENDHNFKIKNIEFRNYVDDIIKAKRPNDFMTEEYLYKVISDLERLEPESISPKDLLLMANNIFRLVVHNPYDIIEERDFFKLLNLPSLYLNLNHAYFIRSHLYHKIVQFYNLFNHKFNDDDYTENYYVDQWINILDSLFTKLDDGNRITNVIDFAIEARRYYVQMDSFVAEVQSYINDFSEFNNPSMTLGDFRKERLIKVAHINGVYESSVYDELVDKQKIEKINQFLHDIYLAEIRYQRIEKSFSEVQNDYYFLMKDIMKLDVYKEPYYQAMEVIKIEYERKYEQMIEKINHEIISQKEQLKKANEQEYKRLMKNLEDYSKQKLTQLMIELKKEKSVEQEPFSNEPIQEDNPELKRKNIVFPNPSFGLNSQDQDTGVRYELDENIPLKHRIEYMLEKKASDQWYHQSFDQVVKYVLNNDIVYLYGPPGSGKSYIINQIAELLDLPLYYLELISTNYSPISGIIDINGNLVETSFYKAYKYGGICVLDSIDYRSKEVINELNQSLGIRSHRYYTFANGETVQAHPNFRMIVSGLKSSVDKHCYSNYSKIYIGYDKQLEHRIMENHEELYQTLMTLRKSRYDNIHSYSDLITTRDLFEFVQKLDTGCFEEDEIISSQLIEHLNSQYSIEQLIKYMEENKHEKFVKQLRKLNERRRR